MLRSFGGPLLGLLALLLGNDRLHARHIAALQKEVSDLLKAHFGLRMQRATQQLTNHTQLGNTRRDVARVKTIIAEKKRQQIKQEAAK